MHLKEREGEVDGKREFKRGLNKERGKRGGEVSIREGGKRHNLMMQKVEEMQKKKSGVHFKQLRISENSF